MSEFMTIVADKSENIWPSTKRCGYPGKRWKLMEPALRPAQCCWALFRGIESVLRRRRPLCFTLLGTPQPGVRRLVMRALGYCGRAILQMCASGSVGTADYARK